MSEVSEWNSRSSVSDVASNNPVFLNHSGNAGPIPQIISYYLIKQND